MTSPSNLKTMGTWPVFLTAISTILGAILFLRFGYAVAHVGLFSTLMIVLVGHLVTVPTALAVAEIATNQKVEGGGAYYMISRSFGLNIGGAIGLALYLSQAISVAFTSSHSRWHVAICCIGRMSLTESMSNRCGSTLA